MEAACFSEMYQLTDLHGVKMQGGKPQGINWFFMSRQSQQSFNTLTPPNFLFYSLHVSAPTGHPQVRYTISYYLVIISEGLF
jgi:hypothetical protein